MKNNLKEITDIKEIISSSKSCKFDEECTLESKYGKVTLSLDVNASKTYIYLKRLSGNGKVLIGSESVNISSRISHCYEVMRPVESLEISRPGDGTGEVSIYGVSFLYDDVEEGDKLTQNWKNIIARCGEYEFIRLVTNRLFATQGAYIANGSMVKEIETNPPGMAQKLISGRIMFLGACEITNLVIDDAVPIAANPAHNVYVHREAAMPLVLPKEPLPPPPPQLPRFGEMKPQGKSVIPNPILYDSVVAREFDRAKIGPNSPIKFIRSNGIDFLHIKKGGSYTIPMSFIRPNIEYIVIISSKRLNGNGKMQVGFVHSGKTIHSGTTMTCENNSSDTYLNLNSSNSPSMGEGYRLMFSMADNSSGEVLISRIQVIEGIALESYRTFKANPRPVAFTPIQIAPVSITGNDPVASMSRTFSILPMDSYQPLTTFNLTGTIQTTSFGTAQWISKIRPMFPQLKINSGSINLLNSQRTTDLPDVVLGSLGSIIPNKRVWVEEFQGEVPSRKDMDALQASSIIMSPSQPNVQFFRKEFPSKRVIQVPKIWPHIQTSVNNDFPYVIYFEKNPILTNILLQSWDDSFPVILVVGTCQTLPQKAIPISPYLPYRDLISLLNGAQGLVDLNSNNHYMSGILDLAHSCGIKIVTNNHWLSFAKPKPVYVPSKTFINGIMIPDINELRLAVSRMLAMTQPRADMENYNLNLEAALQTMIGAE